MRGAFWSFAAAAGVAVWAAGSVNAARTEAAQVEPIVTIESGETVMVGVVAECNDGVRTRNIAESVVVRRSTSGPPIDIPLEFSGARPGIDFAPLAPSATIADGNFETTVTFDPLTNSELTRPVDLTVTLVEGEGYSIGEPSKTTITFVSPRDPSLPPKDCNPGFVVTDAPTNSEQTIRVGEVPVPIATSIGPYFLIDVVGGRLPPGVELDPDERDLTRGFGGGFIGAATTTGDYDATLRLCPGNIVQTCREQNLTVHVLDDLGAELPMTGGRLSAWLEIGCALLVVGAGLGRFTRRWPYDLDVR